MGASMGVQKTDPTKLRKRKKLKTIIKTTIFIVIVIFCIIFREKIASALPFEISDTVSELVILRRG